MSITSDITIEAMKYHGPGFAATIEHGADCETYAQVWLPQTEPTPGSTTPARTDYAAAWTRACGDSDHQDGDYTNGPDLATVLAVFDNVEGIDSDALKAAFTAAVG